MTVTLSLTLSHSLLVWLQSENNFLLMWFDFTGDDKVPNSHPSTLLPLPFLFPCPKLLTVKVSFDEYQVVLAAVLHDAGSLAAVGLDKAQSSYTDTHTHCRHPTFCTKNVCVSNADHALTH